MGGEFHSSGVSDRPLKVLSPEPGDSSISITTDVYNSPSVPAVLGPRSVQFNGRQALKTETSFSEVIGDATVEFWLRWPLSGADSFTLEVGAEDGPRVVVARANNNTSFDKFGILGKDGEYRAAATFTNWAAWNDEFEAVNSYWWVLAMTVKSTGIDDIGNGEIAYRAGSFAIFFINNHELGLFDPNNNFEFMGKVDLGGLKVSPSSKLMVKTSSGSKVKVDDFLFWKKDLSNGGNNLEGLFSNGRGPDPSSVAEWSLY